MCLRRLREKPCLLVKSMEKDITPKGHFSSQVCYTVSGVTYLSPLTTESKHKVLARFNRMNTQLNASQPLLLFLRSSAITAAGSFQQDV